MPSHRRDFFARVSSACAGLVVGQKLIASIKTPPTPVITPDVPDLPFTLDAGVKVFHLIAEPVKQVILPGRTFDLWGFNGSAPGPTIQANQGDRVRIVFDNHLPEPTAIHWHGFEIPIGMDGVPGINGNPIMPGARFVYEFTLDQEGTFFYHSHMAMQEMIGMLGAFILHPKVPYKPHVDKDYVILLQEYQVLPNNTVPNTMSMEYNWLTFNGKASPASTPLIIKEGERVRVRMINLGMDHHPVHLHGFTFWETGREGARQPEVLWARGNTVLVGVAQARDIEFVASRTGDWMLHCHLPHHMMNQMTSMVGPMSRVGASMPGMNMPGMSMPGMSMQSSGGKQGSNMPKLPADANKVPGFPQDAYMESPMAAMDDAVAKPETHGLPSGWSGYMGGMMTLVRVLPPDKYAEIMSLKEKEKRA